MHGNAGAAAQGRSEAMHRGTDRIETGERTGDGKRRENKKEKVKILFIKQILAVANY